MTGSSTSSLPAISWPPTGPPDDYARRVIATGFIAQAKRFGTTKLEDIHQIIEDTLNTTGQVVLGLSLRCARCHDHKYDPITLARLLCPLRLLREHEIPLCGCRGGARARASLRPSCRRTRSRPVEAKHAAEISRLKEEIHLAETKSDLAIQSS